MDENAAIVNFGAIAKQLLAIVSATLCIYFGFRLFYITQAEGGEFEASTKWVKVRLIRAAPGVFFTLFGCMVLVGALFAENRFVRTASVPTPKTESGNPPIPQFKIQATGANSAGPTQMDWGQCAKSALFARDDFVARNSSAADPGRQDLMSGLDQILAYCVDQQLGDGSYARYARVERLRGAGGANDASDADKVAHTKVSDLLSE